MAKYEAVYFGVGLLPPSTMVILSVNPRRRDCIQDARDRVGVVGVDEKTIDAISVGETSGTTASQLRLWLAEHGILGADASDAIKAFAEAVLHMVAESTGGSR